MSYFVFYCQFCSGSITSVGEESHRLLVIMRFLFREVDRASDSMMAPT